MSRLSLRSCLLGLFSSGLLLLVALSPPVVNAKKPPTTLYESTFVDERSNYRWNVTRATYKQALKNADSGTAHDAYMVSCAYITGWSKGKSHKNGQDREQAWHYLNLAASLGSGAANFRLYACYEGNSRCAFTDRFHWDQPADKGPFPASRPDPIKARAALDIAEREDYTIYRSGDDPDHRARWRANFNRRQAISTIAATKRLGRQLEPSTNTLMYPDAYEFCARDYEFNLARAETHPKEDCAGSRTFTNTKYCSEIGSLKTHLKHCMVLASNLDEYEGWLQKYLLHFNLRQDVTLGDNRFLRGVRDYYLDHGAIDKADLVLSWIEDAEIAAAPDRAVAQRQMDQDRSEAGARIRAREAEKQRRTEAARRWDEGRPAREAKARREKQSFGQILSSAMVNSSLHQEALRREERQRFETEAFANIQDRKIRSQPTESSGSSKLSFAGAAPTTSLDEGDEAAGDGSAGDPVGEQGPESNSTQQTIEEWRGGADSDSDRDAGSDTNGDTVSSTANTVSTKPKKDSKKKPAKSRYDVGLSDKSFGDALEKAMVKLDRVCSEKGGAVNIYHESVEDLGFKFKAHVTYQCKDEVLEAKEYGGYGFQKN